MCARIALLGILLHDGQRELGWALDMGGQTYMIGVGTKRQFEHQALRNGCQGWELVSLIATAAKQADDRCRLSKHGTFAKARFYSRL